MPFLLPGDGTNPGRDIVPERREVTREDVGVQKKQRLIRMIRQDELLSSAMPPVVG